MFGPAPLYVVVAMLRVAMLRVARANGAAASRWYVQYTRSIIELRIRGADPHRESACCTSSLREYELAADRDSYPCTAMGRPNGIATRNHMSEPLLPSMTRWRCGELVLSVGAVVQRWENGHPAQDDRVQSSCMSVRSLSANRAQRLWPTARTTCPLHTCESNTSMA